MFKPLFIIINFTLTLLAGAQLSYAQTSNKELLKSEYLKKLVYSVIEDEVMWSEKITEDMGSMWLGDIGEATTYVMGKITKAKTSGALIMNTVTEFSCGSEHDESDMYGYCEITLSKLPQEKWEITSVGKCVCGDY